MEEIKFSLWLFEGRIRQGKNELPDGQNRLCYFAGNSKSHLENSISFIFSESPYQVDRKTLSNPQNTFFRYFNTLETHSERYFKFSVSGKENVRLFGDTYHKNISTF